MQLETANLGAAAICSVQNLSRAIQQNSDSSNLSQLVGDVAPDIDNILELVDDIAQVILFNILSVLEILTSSQLNAYLKLSLGLLTLVGKVDLLKIHFIDDGKTNIECANKLGNPNIITHFNDSKKPNAKSNLTTLLEKI